MSKKILSVVLVLVLLVATAAVSVSAADGVFYEPKEYVASDAAKEIGLKRYFFLLPDEWTNDYTTKAGIYWWDGADACTSMAGEGSETVKWPGYAIYQFTSEKVTQNYTDADGNEKTYEGTVWYVDVPADVTTIIFNNALDGGELTWDNKDEVRYVAAVQTVDIGSEYYEAGESVNYPDGLDEVDGFKNMIYIVDPTQTSENPVNGKLTYAGEWYYYHGGNKWDTQLDPVYGGADGDLPGEPETAGPTTPSDPQTTTVPAPQQGATSNVASPDQDSTVAGNGTIATDGFSMAMVMLVVAAAVVGVAVVVRKRQIEG